MDAKREFSAISQSGDLPSDENTESNPKRAKLVETSEDAPHQTAPELEGGEAGIKINGDAEHPEEEEDPETVAQRKEFAEMVATARTEGKSTKQIFIDAGWTALAVCVHVFYSWTAAPNSWKIFPRWKKPKSRSCTKTVAAFCAHSLTHFSS
jgi:hypothetical protein